MPAQVARLAAWDGALRWLADVPRDICAQLVIELDKAWQRCFAKLGAVRAVVHRAVSGTAKTCALVCEGGAWFACVAHARAAADPAPSTQPPVGIDLDGGLGRFVALLRDKAEAEGARVVEVPAAYSSQECYACGHVAAASRRTQSEIECVACGHRDHADTNAARVLRRRGMRGAEGCGGDGTARPAKQQLRVARRGTRSDPGALVVTTKAPGCSPG